MDDSKYGHPSLERTHLSFVGFFERSLGSKIGDLNFRCLILRFYGDFYS